MPAGKNPALKTNAGARLEVRREVSAGGLIWRLAPDGHVEVVLVRPAGKNTWVLPKGHVEAGESVLEAALREAREESGLEVRPGKPLGQVTYLYSWRSRATDKPIRIFKRVHFFLMEYAGGDPSRHDHEIDEVVWIPLAEARRRASHKSERDLIAKAAHLLAATTSANSPRR
ncbi:MAG TPA: NUDIX hydrolase [Candidatus Binataceae bacterium]|jgi:8-oxo-dGTP pyrophosphatase MutT (NUDIX family)|nr:NUDIX hydrolase [Candidatus Binataceae bacterium]